MFDFASTMEFSVNFTLLIKKDLGLSFFCMSRSRKMLRQFFYYIKNIKFLEKLHYGFSPFQNYLLAWKLCQYFLAQLTLLKHYNLKFKMSFHV